MKVQFTQFLIVPISLCWISACGGNTSSEDGIEVSEVEQESMEIILTKEQFQTMKMEWDTLKMGEFSEEISVQGAVQIPVEGKREIAGYFGGHVNDLKWIEGQEVRKGQVLFTLENPEFLRLQQDYLEVRSQLSFLKAEYERQKTLASEQISSQKNYLKAEADYEGALAKTQSLEKQLALLQIDGKALTPGTMKSKIAVISPIHGFVDEVNAIPGQFLAAGTKAMTLLSREHLHVELVLFEKDAHKVQPGQKLELTSPDRPDQIFNASIYVVGKTINEQRQVYVHADLLDGKQEALLLPGMFLQARIQLDPSQGLAVPEEAVIEVGQEYYILIQKSINDQGYVLEKVKVTPGSKTKNYLSITPERALDASTLVLVKGAYNLL
ncbi:MAG: hypothetical protein RL407_1146 [Bacteroidota bacterium]|jgi:membrane fusion protein, heavy metal efflux system